MFLTGKSISKCLYVYTKVMAFYTMRIQNISSSSKTVHLTKTVVFPVVTYGYESWTIKKAECQRTDAFEM